MIIQLDERYIDSMLSLQSQHPAIPQIDLPASREAYLAAFRAGGFWLGCTGMNDLIGFLGCAIPAICPAMPSRERTGQLTALLVHEEQRRRGIGRALVEAALQELSRRDCPHVSAVVAPCHTAALWLLDSVGFRMANILTSQNQYRYLLVRNLEQ